LNIDALGFQPLHRPQGLWRTMKRAKAAIDCSSIDTAKLSIFRSLAPFDDFMFDSGSAAPSRRVSSKARC